MTLEEAKKVADILSQADGGCPYCVETLRNYAAKAFPQFKWDFEEYEGIKVGLEL